MTYGHAYVYKDFWKEEKEVDIMVKGLRLVLGHHIFYIGMNGSSPSYSTSCCQCAWEAVNSGSGSAYFL